VNWGRRVALDAYGGRKACGIGGGSVAGVPGGNAGVFDLPLIVQAGGGGGQAGAVIGQRGDADGAALGDRGDDRGGQIVGDFLHRSGEGRGGKEGGARVPSRPGGGIRDDIQEGDER